jgi:hypothetical protein
MEWRFSIKMKIGNFFKIGLFVVLTSIFFTACSNKSIKSAEKPKPMSITDVLNDSFEYNKNQKLYKNKSLKEDDVNKLSFRFGKFCSQKQGKLAYTDYYINQDYTKSYTDNKAIVCLINRVPYFITHQAKEKSNVYYTVGMDEQIKKDYLDFKKNKQLELIKANQENAQNSIKEREEIQKRERAREQKTRMLLNKKGQRTMTFFDSWRYTGNKTSCSNKCTNINLKSTGFKTLKEAISNNWQLVSKVGDIEEAIDDSCTCTGYSVLVKKEVSTNQTDK